MPRYLKSLTSFSALLPVAIRGEWSGYKVGDNLGFRDIEIKTNLGALWSRAPVPAPGGQIADRCHQQSSEENSCSRPMVYQKKQEEEGGIDVPLQHPG